MSTISKELDREAIPNAVITGFTSIAYNVGANRIIFGGHFTSPAGDPALPPDREKHYRRRILEKAFTALKTEVDSPKIFHVDESKEGEK